MTRGQPKLREDLSVTRQDGRGGVHFVVKDPATGRFFRFGPAEQYIAQRLDGQTSLEEIQRGAEA